jgi:purine nucleoside phosphorylase
MTDTVGHHSMPEIVIHRDTDDDWKRISLVDDYGGKISLSVEQLRSLATEVLSDTFRLITGL